MKIGIFPFLPPVIANRLLQTKKKGKPERFPFAVNGLSYLEDETDT
jgi:hypothetical protein